MTQDEIIRMAREAGFVGYGENGYKKLERFASLVAAHEREVCAKICDDGGRVQVNDHYTKGMSHASRLLAAAIRARGMDLLTQHSQAIGEYNDYP